MARAEKDNNFRTASNSPVPENRRAELLPLAYFPIDPDYKVGATLKPSNDTTVLEMPTSTGGLHAEQHYEYHAPVHPGDVLTAETTPGKTWERESKRAGKLTFRERVTEYRNQKGELVVTARGVGVTTERPVDQG